MEQPPALLEGPGLAELARRLDQVENALADAQARVPALRREVRAIRHALGKHADQAAAPAYPAD